MALVIISSVESFFFWIFEKLIVGLGWSVISRKFDQTTDPTIIHEELLIFTPEEKTTPTSANKVLNLKVQVSSKKAHGTVRGKAFNYLIARK